MKGRACTLRPRGTLLSELYAPQSPDSGARQEHPKDAMAEGQEASGGGAPDTTPQRRWARWSRPRLGLRVKRKVESARVKRTREPDPARAKRTREPDPARAKRTRESIPAREKQTRKFDPARPKRSHESNPARPRRKRASAAPLRGWFQARRVSFARAGLALALAVISLAYAGPLNRPAATVLAVRRELPVYCVARDDNKIAISFDASWGGDKTLAILDILDEFKVKTTFFLVGIWVDRFPELVQEIAARGHEIGNHSASHPHMSQLSEQKIKEELSIMNEKVVRLTSVPPTLFRPPYGDYNDRVVTTARAQGFEAVQWSVDSLDWKNRGTDDIVRQCTKAIQSGDIVLFHNDSQDILNALPEVLRRYQQAGLTIVPVSELLLEGPTTIDVQGRQHPTAAGAPSNENR